MNTAIVRVNITLPARVWNNLEYLVPRRGKSRFIADAIEDKLHREKRAKVFAQLTSLPPAFSEIRESAVYIHRLRRKEEEKRSKRLSL